MRYQKANEILPVELVELIQDYIDGEYVYIPRKQENKKGWGETSRAREELQSRNIEIFVKYSQGLGIKDLAEQYFLSEKCIQRIVLQERKKSEGKQGSVPE
nr:CD3324 family protein [uncultured Lachnoclostridium sp.]